MFKVTDELKNQSRDTVECRQALFMVWLIALHKGTVATPTCQVLLAVIKYIFRRPCGVGIDLVTGDWGPPVAGCNTFLFFSNLMLDESDQIMPI